MIMLSILCLLGKPLADTVRAAGMGDYFEFTFDTLAFSEGIRRVEAGGSRAFVRTVNNEVFILDITDPTTPGILGSFESAGEPVPVSDDYVYMIFDAPHGIDSPFVSYTDIYDISDPAAPVLVNTIQTAIAGRVGYLGAGVQRTCGYYYVELLEIWIWQCLEEHELWDLSDPASPVSIDHFWEEYYPHALVEAGGSPFVAYAVDGADSVHIFDLNDVHDPVRVDAHAVVGGVLSIYSSGEYIFVETYDDRTTTFRLSSDGHLTFMGRADNWPISPRQMRIMNGYGFAADDNKEQILIIDFTDAREPFIADTICCADSSFGSIAVADNRLLVSDDTNLLIIGITATSCCGHFTGGLTGNTDCSEDGSRNMADITRLIDYVYESKELLCCRANGNIDGSPDGKRNLADITRLIDHVYISKRETAACQ
jgi:hypothetical protein